MLISVLQHGALHYAYDIPNDVLNELLHIISKTTFAPRRKQQRPVFVLPYVEGRHILDTLPVTNMLHKITLQRSAVLSPLPLPPPRTKGAQKKHTQLLANIKKASEARQMRGFACAIPAECLTVTHRLQRLRMLRTVPQPEQRSPAWYKMREGMLTASDFHRALTSDASRLRFALDKVVPKSFGASGSAACRHGVRFEPVCGLVYERLRSAKVEDFGLLPHSKHAFIGASPDGICDESSCDECIGRAVEFKAPYSRTIVQGEVPAKYLAQIQGQLEVMELPVCDYLECAIESCLYSPGSQPPSSRQWCGLVLEVDAETCRYSPILDMSTPHALDAAYQAMLAGGSSSCSPVYLWWLHDHNLVTVYRNSEWFVQIVLPALQSVWHTVDTFRKCPDKLRAAQHSKSSSKKRKTPYKFR
jgi:hypothetical protein